MKPLLAALSLSSCELYFLYRRKITGSVKNSMNAVNMSTIFCFLTTDILIILLGNVCLVDVEATENVGSLNNNLDVSGEGKSRTY